MENFEAVLFDLDGTLIDSEHFYFSSWAPILLERYDLKIDFKDWLRDFAGHTLSYNVKRLQDQYHFEVDEKEMWDTTRARYAEAGMKNIKLMPGAKEILEILKLKSRRIGLVTSSHMSTVQEVLGAHSLLDCFEFFVTREQVTLPKPNPEPYLLATRKLGVSVDKIVVVEDTQTGYNSALAAGLKCMVVSSNDIERDRLARAENLFMNLFDLKKYFLDQFAEPQQSLNR